jgi:hypothetical protein
MRLKNFFFFLGAIALFTIILEFLSLILAYQFQQRSLWKHFIRIWSSNYLFASITYILKIFLLFYFSQSLLPPSVLSNDTELLPFVANIIKTLNNLTNIDDRLRKSFKEFYAYPDQQKAVCGVFFLLILFI